MTNKRQPAFLIRQPKHLLLLWVIMLVVPVGAVMNDGGSWRLAPALLLTVAAAYEIAKILLASVRVGPEQIVFRGVRRSETIAIDEFVTIERDSWLRGYRRQLAVTTTGSTWVPWWHPNLAAAIHIAIEDVKKELESEPELGEQGTGS